MEERLIEAVKGKECLYNIRSPLYKNLKYKEKVWNEVAEIVGADVKKCKQRWKSLRERARREYHYIPSGSAAINKMEWPYTKSLRFLKDIVKPAETVSNYTHHQTVTLSDDDYGDSHLSDIVQYDSPIKATDDGESNFSDIIEYDFLSPVKETVPSTSVRSSELLPSNIEPRKIASTIASTIASPRNILPSENANTAATSSKNLQRPQSSSQKSVSRKGQEDAIGQNAIASAVHSFNTFLQGQEERRKQKAEGGGIFMFLQNLGEKIVRAKLSDDEELEVQETLISTLRVKLQEFKDRSSYDF